MFVILETLQHQVRSYDWHAGGQVNDRTASQAKKNNFVAFEMFFLDPPLAGAPFLFSHLRSATLRMVPGGSGCGCTFTRGRKCAAGPLLRPAALLPLQVGLLLLAALQAGRALPDVPLRASAGETSAHNG